MTYENNGFGAFTQIQYIGENVVDPDAAPTSYQFFERDEIVYMDTVASLYGRNNILGVVEAAARDIFVPLTVGGGIRGIDDIVADIDQALAKVVG